jgi:hypothetical protein
LFVQQRGVPLNGDELRSSGAGAGSSKPLDRHIIAVKPSLMSIHQRPGGLLWSCAPRRLICPSKDTAFAAALAVLTYHRWTDRQGNCIKFVTEF